MIRWLNLIILFVTQYLVFTFIVKNKETALHTWVPPISFFLLSLATILIAAAGYIINDYYDIKIDLVNKPYRIVVGKMLSRRQALLLHSLLNITAISLGFILSWRVALFFAASAFLLWLYSNYFKRTPLLGNVIVALLSAATIWVIGLYFHENDELIYIYSLFAFLVSLLREVVKDIEDVKGDAAYGCKTLPIVWGIRRTKLFLFAILSIVCLFTVYFLVLGSVFSLPIYPALLLLPMCYFGCRLALADKQRDYAHLSGVCKYLMVLGVLSLGFA